MEITGRKVCVACGAEAPETETDFTLISARHGWRLSRRTATDGTYVMEWRCPTCWTAYKAGPREDEAPGSAPDSAEASRRHVASLNQPPSATRERSRRAETANDEVLTGLELPPILLVGDDALAQATMARALLRAGLGVHAVTSAALLEATMTRPRLIVVDLGDPGSDVIERIEVSFPRRRIVVRTNVMLEIPARRVERYEVISRDAPVRLVVAAVKRGLVRRGMR